MKGTLISFFFLLLIIKTDIPEIQIIDDLKNQYQYIEVCLTKDNQCFNLLFDIDSLYTWVPSSENKQEFNKKFNEKVSDIQTINSNINVKYENKKSITGKLLSTVSTIAKTSLNNFQFISVSSNEENYNKTTEGYFGLGYPYTNDGKTYSILMNLEKNNHIKKKVFTVVFNKEKKGTLLLGTIPNNINNDMKNYGTCNIESSFSNDYGHWYCKMKGLLLGKSLVNDKMIKFDDNSNNKFKFDYKNPRSIVPISYLLQIQELYFYKLIDNSQCTFSMYKGFFSFSCSSNNYNELNEIILIVNDEFGYLISKEDLFVYNDEIKKYDFIFYGNNANEFIIGSNILKRFSMVFNMDENKIGMYNSDNKIIKMDELKKKEEEEKKKKEEEEKKKKEEEKKKKEEEEKKKKEEEEKKKKEEEEKKKKEEEKKKPLIDDKNPNNPKQNEEPTIIVPKKPSGGFTFGKFILIVIICIALFFGYRYYKRRKGSNSSNFYYKAANELFNSGIQLEEQ